MPKYILHQLIASPDSTRFTTVISEALAAQRADVVVQQHVGGGIGTWQLGAASCRGLLDDVLVIESTTTRHFKVIDFQDSYTMAYELSQSSLFKGAALMMYHPATVAERYGAKAHLVGPGWFLDQTPGVVKVLRAQVQELRADWAKLDPRLYFRGTIDGETPNKVYQRGGQSIREVARVLRARYPDEVDISGLKDPRNDWLLNAARHQFVLTLPGHPWCYREFEMMSLGIPTLAYRWTSYLYHQPVYYFPVENVRQDAIGFAVDPEEGAEAIITKFRQVRADGVLAASVGSRAQQWYDRYLTPQAIAADMLTWLDLDSLDL